MKRGYVFESDTDTEIIAKLIHHLWTQHPTYSFRELVEQVVMQIVSKKIFNFSQKLVQFNGSQKKKFKNYLRKVYYADFYIKIKFIKNLKEGAFALAFKSIHFPGECVATRRGSPLLVGIKTKTRLATDHIPILYKKGNGFFFYFS